MAASASNENAPVAPGWLRFSLKSALALITIYCIWLAMVAFEARGQRHAIQKVQQLGGSIAFSFELDSAGSWKQNPRPLVPAWIRRTIGDDYFRSVAIINFDEGSDPTDDDLGVMKSLNDLQQLTLANRKMVTDKGLANLAGLRSLEVLVLDGTRVSGPGLRHLRNLNQLEGITLSSTPLDDDGLEYLAELQNLKWLHLNDTNISDAGLRHLAGLANLEYLQLVNTRVTDAGLKQLTSLGRLKRVLLRGTKTTPAGRAALQRALPNCQVPQ